MAVTRYFHCQYCMVQEAHHDVGVVLVTLLALCVGGGGGGVNPIRYGAQCVDGAWLTISSYIRICMDTYI